MNLSKLCSLSSVIITALKYNSSLLSSLISFPKSKSINIESTGCLFIFLNFIIPLVKNFSILVENLYFFPN